MVSTLGRGSDGIKVLLAEGVNLVKQRRGWLGGGLPPSSRLSATTCAASPIKSIYYSSLPFKLIHNLPKRNVETTRRTWGNTPHGALPRRPRSARPPRRQPPTA